MSSRIYRFMSLLGALLALLGFFFPLYSSALLSPDLARGPLNQSFQATLSFFPLLSSARQSHQIQATQLLFPIISFVLYWMILLLVLFVLVLGIYAYRYTSSRAQKWSLVLTISGFISVQLLILCHVFTFLENVLAVVQKRVPTAWETLQQVGNVRFRFSLTVFYQSSFLGIWFPVMGFLIIFFTNWLLKSQKRLPLEAQ
jgi:hypothetical protein